MSSVSGEIWKVIDEFPCYEVSNTGFVRIVESQKKGISIPGTILKFRPGGVKKQYLRVSLYRNGQSYDRYVHRLVCAAFNGPAPSELMQVAHLDGNSKDNRAENLMWASVSENHGHKRLHGTAAIGERNPQSKLDSTQANEILTQYALGSSSLELSQKYKVTIGTILGIASGRSWSHVGTEELRAKAKEICRRNILAASASANARRKVSREV